MGYTIEKLTPENYQRCDNIWNMSKHPEMAKKFYDQLVDGNRIIFVYIEDGEYLGEGSVVFDKDDPDYTIPHERIYLSRMVVKKEHRGRGIGSIILGHIFDYARGLGYKEISVGVDIDNYRARWLYEKNGFTNTIFVGEDTAGKYVKLLKTL